MGQENKKDSDYPFLSKAFFQINLGYVDYGFDESILNDGFEVSGYRRNPFSGRLLLGYKFNEEWALQYGVMRPAVWFEFENVNGTNLNKSVFVNSWFLSLSRHFKIDNNWSLFAEAGPARVTRKGFLLGNLRGVEDRDYFSLLTVGGIKYKLNDRWDLSAQTVYTPETSSNNTPIYQFTAGIQYNLSKLVPKEYHEESEVFFPKNTFQLGYANDAVGYAANKFFSLQARVGNFRSVGVPIFWYGDAKAQHTFHLNYNRTVYKGKKIFSLSWGSSLTAFQSTLEKEWVVALSIYPQLNFYFWRNEDFNMYANYSVIGPTYISVSDIDGLETGPNVTYQDFMGVGAYFGKNNSYNAELKIIHYSNGNIFNKNDGVAIPLVFTFGKSF